MDESEEAGSELIEAGGDPSELLELEEEGFHKMALFVEPPIDISQTLSDLHLFVLCSVNFKDHRFADQPERTGDVPKLDFME